MTLQTSPPSPLDPRERARTLAWLRRRGRPAEGLHPLTERRWAARYRAYRIEVVAVWAAAGLFVVWSVWQLIAGEDAGTAATLAGFIAAYLILAGGSLLGLQHQRRADRRLAAALPERVARPVAVSPADLLGGWYLLAAAVANPGALATGVVGLLTADQAVDRAAAAAFMAGRTPSAP